MTYHGAMQFSSTGRSDYSVNNRNFIAGLGPKYTPQSPAGPSARTRDLFQSCYGVLNSQSII
jgi:hypothetical protein